MMESLIHSKRIHLSIYALARFKRHLQVVSGDFDRQWIGDHLAGAVLVFHPCGMRQGHPHRTSVHQKFDVHRVSVPRSNSPDGRLIDTMLIPFAPAIDGEKVLIHSVIKTISKVEVVGKPLVRERGTENRSIRYRMAETRGRRKCRTIAYR